MKLAHLSDLHFGAVEPGCPEALRTALIAAAPDLIVVSGDLSQRGTIAELSEAKAWLDSLPIPQIVIPGNHDLPRGWRIWDRFWRPWHRYRKIVSEDLEPVWRGDGLIVIGTNSARAAGWNFDWSRGRISRDQLARIRSACQDAGPDVLRVLAIHHPPAGPPAGTGRALLGRREKFFDSVSQAGIDLVLAGHFHTSYAVIPATQAGHSRNCVLSVTTTATSHRRKGEPNGFHLIEGDATALRVTACVFPDTSPARPCAAPSRRASSWTFRSTDGSWAAGEAF